MDYYGDNDRHACAWLQELVKDGQIPEGKVDERDIKTLARTDLAGYRRVHLFAGIGGWAYALELAGWPADRPVWTGSCPCQPFSAAGKRKGQADERHLWPVFLGLVRQCRPATIFGEQVASDDGYRWLARVRDDLEEAGYAVGCADLPACSQGAPHIRQRLFWVANAERAKLPWAKHPQRRAVRHSPVGRLADTSSERSQERRGNRRVQPKAMDARKGQTAFSAGNSFWAESRIIHCGDGKLRRIPSEPSLFPLAHGISGRVGLLRGAGNAISPQTAATFIRAFLDVEESLK